MPAVAQGPPMQDVSYPCNSSDTKREIGTIYPQLLTPVVTSTPLSTVVTQNERGRSRKKNFDGNLFSALCEDLGSG